MEDAAIGVFGWERTARVVEKVKERLKRASSALGEAGVLYAVVGGNAKRDSSHDDNLRVERRS